MESQSRASSLLGGRQGERGRACSLEGLGEFGDGGQSLAG